MVVRIPYRLVPFHQKVGTLYKKWVRQLESNIFNREEFRYQARLARAEFDAILAHKDMRISKQMLLEKEKRFEDICIYPKICFPTQPEGVAYERQAYIEDWFLDQWHPLEKAMFPSYFAKRELRKQQFIEMWQKEHGPKKPCDD